LQFVQLTIQRQEKTRTGMKMIYLIKKKLIR
jgi:hypothetical protein